MIFIYLILPDFINLSVTIETWIVMALRLWSPRRSWNTTCRSNDAVKVVERVLDTITCLSSNQFQWLFLGFSTKIKWLKYHIPWANLIVPSHAHCVRRLRCNRSDWSGGGMFDSDHEGVIQFSRISDASFWGFRIGNHRTHWFLCALLFMSPIH